MAGGAVGCDGPPAPSTGPVVSKVAQGCLPADPDRAVTALDGTLDTTRRERVSGIQRGGKEPADVSRAVCQTDLAVADEDGAEGIRAPYAPNEARGGKVVPVLASTAQAFDISKVQVLQDDDLYLCGEGHEIPRLLRRHRTGDGKV